MIEEIRDGTAQHMRLIQVIGVGAAVGALAGAGIFFAPNEPYPLEIFLASTLRVSLVALVTALTLREKCSWLKGLGYGLLYGLVTGVIVFLSKGGIKSMDAPFVIPSALITGAIVGVLIARYGFHSKEQAEDGRAPE